MPGSFRFSELALSSAEPEREAKPPLATNMRRLSSVDREDCDSELDATRRCDCELMGDCVPEVGVPGIDDGKRRKPVSATLVGLSAALSAGWMWVIPNFV